jgi:hypothetical protein
MCFLIHHKLIGTFLFPHIPIDFELSTVEILSLPNCVSNRLSRFKFVGVKMAYDPTNVGRSRLLFYEEKKDANTSLGTGLVASLIL